MQQHCAEHERDEQRFRRSIERRPWKVGADEQSEGGDDERCGRGGSARETGSAATGEPDCV